MTRAGLNLLMVVIVTLSAAGPAAAQPDNRRLEVGVQASFLRLSDFDTTNVGVGGRVSFDLANWIALEGEGRFFPNDDVSLVPSSLTPNLRVAYHRRRAEAFAGVKVGKRSEKIGVFAKVRPGITRLSPSDGRATHNLSSQLGIGFRF